MRWASEPRRPGAAGGSARAPGPPAARGTGRCGRPWPGAAAGGALALLAGLGAGSAGAAPEGLGDFARRAELAAAPARPPAPEATAFGPDLRLEPQALAPDVYLIQGQPALGSADNANFISNAAFVVTPEGVVLIDALGSPPLAERLREAIARITPLPVRLVLVTHYHADHVYGLQAFADRGARIVAHAAGRDYLRSELAARRLADSRLTLAPWVDEDTRLVPAHTWVDRDTVLDFGGLRFELLPAGPAHTPDDLLIHLPQRGLAFAGDLVFRGRIPYVGQADSRGWIAALERLMDLPVTMLVPGHGPASPTPREDLALTRDYLQHLRQAMGRAARELEPFEEAYRQADWSRYAGLPLFDVANRLNAYNTYLLMERDGP